MVKDGILDGKRWHIEKPHLPNRQAIPTKPKTHPNPPEGKELDYLYLFEYK
jgi:hypothetical protein